MHPSASAAALLALALGPPALALHPTHPRELTRHTEAHRSLAHVAPRASRHPQHPAPALHTAHAHGAHTRPARARALHAHTPERRAASSPVHQHALPRPSHLSRVAHHHGRQVPQPTHPFAALTTARASRENLAGAPSPVTTPAHHDDPATPTSVVSIIRPTPGSHPQLPDLAEAVTEPIALPKLYDERGRLLVPAALVGSHDILLHQNTMADQDGLGRIQNDADLDAMRARGMLVALPASPALNVDPRLPANRRVARPWTAQFLADLSRDYFHRFGAPLQLTSAVRTVEFQHQLIHHNGNAAPADGDTASPHLTGQAVDLGKRGMTIAQIAWMRGYLLPLIQSGRIDVEEEFRQSCFHISVYRRYAPATLPDRYSVASRATTSSLATVLP